MTQVFEIAKAFHVFGNALKQLGEMRLHRTGQLDRAHAMSEGKQDKDEDKDVAGGAESKGAESKGSEEGCAGAQQ